jgi:hypothetical protein
MNQVLPMFCFTIRDLLWTTVAAGSQIEHRRAVALKIERQ